MDPFARSKTPKDQRDKRATPWPVYRAICDALGLEPTLDVAAEPHTAMTDEHFTIDDDAFSRPWRPEWSRDQRSVIPVVYMNPPYSKPMPWVERAAEQARLGSIVIGLLPEAGETQWFRHCEQTAAAIYTTARIPFLLNGAPQPGNPKAGKVVVWTPWRTSFPGLGRIEIPSWQGTAGQWSWLPPSITCVEQCSGAYRPHRGEAA